MLHQVLSFINKKYLISLFDILVDVIECKGLSSIGTPL